MREINQSGLDLIKSFEGIEDGNPTTVNLDPYIDPVGIWTIGWGHAIRRNGEFLRGIAKRAQAFALYPGGITKQQAEDLLRGDVLDFCRDVEALVKVSLNDNQFAALVSFQFNTGGLKGSTLLRKLNAGDYAGAANQFAAWNKGTVRGKKVVLNGLVRRRSAEKQLFLTEDGA